MDVSPTEPVELQSLGEPSSLPELHSCDVLWSGSTGLVGVQRKTLRDLSCSLRDGRLAGEVAAMRLLAVRVLLVEGRLRWSPTGFLTTARPSLSKDQLRGLLWSAQARGLWVVHTDDLADSVSALSHLHAWVGKARHTSLDDGLRRRAMDGRGRHSRAESTRRRRRVTGRTRTAFFRGRFWRPKPPTRAPTATRSDHHGPRER